MKKWMTGILSGLLAVLLAIPVYAAEPPEGVIPDERLMPRLVDGADLLTDAEESKLLETLNEISERQQVDVVVVTAESTDGKTPMEYADDFYDYNGYGFGDGRDGVLLLISMEERDWWISSCGYGITAFTDAGIEYMSEQFLSTLGNGDYSKAFTKYAELCDDFITQAKTGNPYDVNNLPKGTVPIYWLFVDLAIGLFIAYLMANNKRRILTSVVRKAGAVDYTVPGSFILNGSAERFVNRAITSRQIVRETEEESSGGSTTHTSSSGTSHGGSGGKF